jgi:hypothetical protein
MLPDHHALLTGIAPEHIEQATAKGLVLKAGLDQDNWSRLVTHLAKNTRAFTAKSDTSCMWLGDVLAYREGKYHGQIAELARAAGFHATTLRNAKLVCGRIPPSCRRDGMPWSHLCEIGKTFSAPHEIVHWLKIIAEQKLSRAVLRRMIREHRKSPELTTAKMGPFENEPFPLMRELRALDRQIQKNRSLWEQWPAHKWRLAGEELGVLVAFVQAIQDRAG